MSGGPTIMSMAPPIGASPSVNNIAGGRRDHEGSIGVAFFGDGIRSSAFGSGVLSQIIAAFPDNVPLLLSGVAGGGLIASAYSQHYSVADCKNPNGVHREDVYNRLDKKMKNNIAYCIDCQSPIKKGIWDVFELLILIVLQGCMMAITIMPFIFFLVEAIASFQIKTGVERLWILPTVGLSVSFGCFLLGEYVLDSKRSVTERNLVKAIKIIMFLGVLFSILIGSQEIFTLIEDRFGQMVSSYLGLGSTSIWVIIRFHPFAFLKERLESMINSLSGYVALLSIFGLFINWRLDGEIDDNKLFGEFQFTNHIWSILLGVSIALILLYPITYVWSQNNIHYYYRYKLQKSFYDVKTGCAGLACLGSSQDKLLKFSHMNDNNQYISTITANLWKTKDDQSPTSTLIVSKINSSDMTKSENKGKIEFIRTDYQNENTVDLEKGKLRDIDLSYAMVNSGASITSLFGAKDEFESWTNFFTLFNLGFGSWFNTYHQKGYRVKAAIGSFAWGLPFGIAFAHCNTYIRDTYPWVIWIPAFMIGIIITFADYMFDVDSPLNPIQSPIIRIFRQTLLIPNQIEDLDCRGYMYLTDAAHSESSGLWALLNKQVSTIFLADGSEDTGRLCLSVKRCIKMARCFGWGFEMSDGNDLDRELIKFETNSSQKSLTFVAYWDPEPPQHKNSAKRGNTNNRVTIHLLKPIKDSTVKAHGMFCECCHSTSLWDSFFGEFPNHSSYFQFFTPQLYEAYKKSGVEACQEALSVQRA